MSFNIFFLFFFPIQGIEGKVDETLQNCFMFVHGLADSRWSSGVCILVFGGSVKPAGDFLIGRWLVRKVGLLPGDL